MMRFDNIYSPAFALALFVELRRGRLLSTAESQLFRMRSPVSPDFSG